MSSHKRYYWLKLHKDFFNSLEMKRLRKVSGGETFTIIYLKMLLESMNDEGYIYFQGVGSDFADELSLLLDESVDDVVVTLSFLEKVGLLEYSDGETMNLVQVKEITGSEGESARRVRQHREQKALHCNTDVTKCNTEKEIEIEIEIDKELDKELEEKPQRPLRQAEEEEVNKIILTSKLVEKIMSNWNALGIGEIRGISNNRRKMTLARLKDYGEDTLLEAISNISKSSFLQGQNNRGWAITYDWFIKPNNFTRVLEGNYNDSEPKKTTNNIKKPDEGMLDLTKFDYR